MKRKIKAWWFCDRDCRLRYGDGRIAKVGTMHEIKKPPIIGERGLHGSRDIVDALIFGSGPICFRIELSGNIVDDDDQLVSRRRTYLWKVDAETLLKEFVKLIAPDMARPWNAADFVKRSLKAGSDSFRVAAWVVDWNAASSAAAYNPTEAEAGRRQSHLLERMIREAHRKEAG